MKLSLKIDCPKHGKQLTWISFDFILRTWVNKGCLICNIEHSKEETREKITKERKLGFN